MGTPSWLYYLLALAMLAVAAYNLGLLVLSLRLNDPAGRDIDVAHIFMGVAMAGMFITGWAFWPSWFWEATFFALMVWFIARSALSLQRFGLHIPHESIHATMSFAMLMMYLYPMGSTPGSMSMSMSSSTSHGILDPGLGLLLATVFLGSAIFTLASPHKGASHHGTHRPAPVLATVGAPSDGTEGAAVAHPTRRGAALTLASPRLEDLSHVVMCLGMAFMLILML